MHARDVTACVLQLHHSVPFTKKFSGLIAWLST